MALIFLVLHGEKMSVAISLRGINWNRHLHFLDLVVGHGEPKLLNAALDGVPARDSGGEVDVAAHAEVGRVDDLVRGGGYRS